MANCFLPQQSLTVPARLRKTHQQEQTQAHPPPESSASSRDCSPFPASVSWTLHSRTYLVGLFASDIDNLRVIRRSEALTASVPMNPATNTGNGRNSTGPGDMLVSREYGNPWYAETKRLCPEMWPPEPERRSVRRDIPGLYRAIFSFSVSGIVRHAARARLWTSEGGGLSRGGGE